MAPITRRNLLINTAAIAGGAVFSNNVVAAITTPVAAEGPFYPEPSMRMADVDNDLVKVSAVVEEAGGVIIQLKGKLISKTGIPLIGHRIEIWQCDVNGKYLHPGDDRDVTYDNSFQGFGHDITDDDGSYSFRTIKPTIYPGRTPHIHVKIYKAERELLTTQFYIAADPNNKNDSLFRRMSAEEAQSVSMLFNEHAGVIEANIDIII